MMYPNDDDKLSKYRTQVKKRKTCRLFCFVVLMAAAALGFVLSGSDSKLVTAAAQYHPEVMDIHRKLNKAAHYHLTTMHHQFSNQHWKLPNTPRKLRGTAASFIQFHHINQGHHKQEVMATEDINSKEVMQNINAEQATLNINAEEPPALE